MPFPINPTYALFFVAVLFLVGLIGAAVLGAVHSFLQARRRQNEEPSVPAAYRHCCYCKWGDAALHEESVKFEDHDRVIVRCYVCNSCGLPQWFVHRVPLTHYAEP